MNEELIKEMMKEKKYFIEVTLPTSMWRIVDIMSVANDKTQHDMVSDLVMESVNKFLNGLPEQVAISATYIMTSDAARDAAIKDIKCKLS